MLKKLRVFSVGYRVFSYQSRVQNLFNTGLKGFVTSAGLCCNKVDMKRSWNKPDGECELKIYNSLTKEKVRSHRHTDKNQMNIHKTIIQTLLVYIKCKVSILEVPILRYPFYRKLCISGH